MRDRSDLSELLQLHRGPDGTLLSPHSVANAGGVVFGGQLLGQALMAACDGMADGTVAHSLHMHFLASGRTDAALRYEARPLMRGRNFTVQQVIGSQAERTVISATVSFQRPEAGPQHQVAMPTNVGDPDHLPTLREVIQRRAPPLPDAIVRAMGSSRTLDLRSADAERFLFERDPQARFRYWVRIKPALPDDPVLHQAALAYLSDYWFSMIAMGPHVDTKLGTGLHVASLSHTVWFHHPARADEWLLVDAGTPFSGGARGLTFGQVFRRDGTLAASLAQEGLYRGWIESAGGHGAPGPSGNGF